MKTKLKFGFLCLLFTNLLSVQAQTATEVATTNVTAIGVQNGALFPSATGLRSTFVGYQAGQGIEVDSPNNTFVGYRSGRQTTNGSNNSFFGLDSGLNNRSGSQNSFIGSLAGLSNTVGSDNVFVGWGAGNKNNGSTNTFVGRSSGDANTAGAGNTFLGFISGLNNQSGVNNVFLGAAAGQNNISGGNNVLTGFGAGSSLNSWGNSIYGTFAGQYSTGDGNVLLGSNSGKNSISSNVMIGSSAGENAIVSNQLFIDNTNTASPLIWGDFSADQLKLNGKVGIGAVTAFPTTAGTVNVSNYKLFVTGGILTDEVRVNLSSSGTWADYVFNKDYNLKPLSEVEKFINDNGHLPNVPSAKQVEEEGIELGNMSKIQQEKIEELTLYLIQQKKEIEELKAQLKVLIEKKQ